MYNALTLNAERIILLALNSVGNVELHLRPQIDISKW